MMWFRVLLLIAVPVVFAADAPAGRLTIRVTGAKSERGAISVALWDRAQGFPRDPKLTVKRATAPVRAGVGTVTFERVQAGVYAISAFHDENDNGKLDTNLVGIPREAYGFSNGARGRMGPPSFDAAKFQFDGIDRIIEIALNN